MISALFEPVSSWISGKPVESLGERRLCERFQIQSHAPLRQIAEPDLLAPDSRTGGSHPSFASSRGQEQLPIRIYRARRYSIWQQRTV
jgi:hypothetical protein